MCPWDESMLKGMKLLQMFLPTVMTRYGWGGGVTVAAGTVARGYSSALRRCMPVLLNKVPFINQSMVYGVTVVGYSSSRYNIYCREEHATFGAGLWFEEMWHHFLSIQSNSLVEPYQVHLFTRVSRYGIC